MGDRDNRIVFTCCKNNNGIKGKQTAWERRADGFRGPLSDSEMDWDAFHNGGGAGGKNEKITEADLEAVFENGATWLTKAAAAKALQSLTGTGHSSAYNALDLRKGRFRDRLHVHPANGTISIAGGDGGESPFE